MAKPSRSTAAKLVAEVSDARVHAMRRAEAESARLRSQLKLANEKLKHSEREIGQLNSRLDIHTTLNARGRHKKLSKPARSKSADGTAILVLSDWHCEETIEPEKVDGLNEFNLEIAERRIKQTFERALLLLEDARHLTDIKELVVAALGDFISGHIHDDLRESNSLSPLPATQFAAEHLERGLRMLLQHSGCDLTVVTSYGNHGRTTPKPRSSTAAETSYEHNLYQWMQKLFTGEKRIRWQVGEGYHNWLTIQDRPVRFHHGDKIKYGGGVGGITIPINKAVAQWNIARRSYLDIFGHFHQFLPHGRWICNGSLIGYAPFSVDIKAEFEVPRQTFAVIDKDRGLTRVLPIFCE